MAQRRILIIEDQRVDALDLLCVLAVLGHAAVGPAWSGPEAMVRLARCLPDAVIISLDLTHGSPLTLAKAADALGIPVLFASRATGVSLPGRFAATCAIPKPCRPARLQAGLMVARKGF